MTQLLKDEDIKKIEEVLILLKSRYVKLVSKLLGVVDLLKNEKAKEYLFHGVARRLDVIERCVENIYSIFPLRREKLLRRDELKDLDINLHAFFVNIFGLLENIAWVVVHEKNGAETINKRGVGLYKDETQKCLDSGFKEYLNSDRMKKWHDKYLKNYRDALSHRIPLYVPPKMLNPTQKKQEYSFDESIRESLKRCDLDSINELQNKAAEVGEVCPFFIHSLSEEKDKYVVLHAQVIADFATVEEILERYCKIFE